ncbi:MBL fold hydrolase [Endomicrobiia bacterium]|nr:MBL fold hydrolase [Endomicrobiia bacterium]GHT71411.1 MBL fold hydrolase [Endomicrobiia bacterium]GHT73232.1 MBL fold hydrolase [Endomicrobiia bacterium]
MKKIFLTVFSVVLFVSMVFADVSVTPYGAAETVSGSCFLLEADGVKIIIDCGLFMTDENLTTKTTELKNLQVQPELIKADVLFLTHAHLDHSGRVPLLIHRGFKGKIYSTKATKELALALFKDRNGFNLIERKWFWSESQMNKARHYSNSAIAHWTKECKNAIRSTECSDDEILLKDLEKRENIKFLLCKDCCKIETKKISEQVVAVEYNKDIDIKNNVKAKLINAGHIPGSASLIFKTADKKVLFSGDIGSGYSKFNGKFDVPESVDLIFMEATYGGSGDRNKNIATQYNLFREDLKQAISSGKTVWIPALAYNRTQKILYELKLMQDDGILPKQIPIYSISPSANSITALYQKEVSKGGLQSQANDWFLKEVYDKATILPKDAKLKMTRNYNKQMVLLSASGDMDKGKSEQLMYKMLTRNDVFVMIVNYVNPKSNAGLALRNERTKAGIKSVAEIKKYDVFSDHADLSTLQKWLSKQNKNVEIYIIHSSKKHTKDTIQLLKKEGWKNVRNTVVGNTIN